MSDKPDSPYILSLQEGDNLFQNILQFADLVNIKSAVLNGLGAVSDITIGYFHRDTQQQVKRLFSGTYELVSLTGNITIFGKDRFLHIHAAIGDDKYQVFGGHVIDALASASTEIAIIPLTYPVFRKNHPELDIKVICPFSINHNQI